MIDDMGSVVLATGALGTAAFGIVEGSKWLRAVGEYGFAKAIALLGPLAATLPVAYGADYDGLLRAQYRGDQKDLVRKLRQGVRVGLNSQNAGPIATFLGSLDGMQLAAAVTAAQLGQVLTADQRNMIGRFELAADANPVY